GHREPLLAQREAALQGARDEIERDGEPAQHLCAKAAVGGVEQRERLLQQLDVARLRVDRLEPPLAAPPYRGAPRQERRVGRASASVRSTASGARAPSPARACATPSRNRTSPCRASSR